MTLTGSPVFWILLALAVIAIVTYFERFMDLRRAQIDYRDFLKGVINVLDAGNDAEALAICEDTSAPVASIVESAVRHRNAPARVLREAVDSQGRAEIGRLDRRLAALAIIGQVAPGIGLLGTFIGFIKTILFVNSSEMVSRAELLSVAMDSLVSAAMGIALAVAVTIMYGSLRVRLERTVVELEAAASQILGYLATSSHKEADA